MGSAASNTIKGDVNVNQQQTTMVSSAAVANQQIVFKELVSLIALRGAENKMVPASAISVRLKEAGIERPHMIVRISLDKLIRHKYVRYYRVGNVLFYGTTALGRERWTVFTSKEVASKEVAPDIQTIKQRPSDEEIWNIQQGKVACKFCGKFFHKRGIGRHQASCAKKAS